MTTQDWSMSGGLPPELALDSERIRKRRSISEALMSRAMSPIPTQQGGRYLTPISPLAPLAQMFSAYAGKKGMDEADAGMKDIGRRYNEGLAEAVQTYMKGGTQTINPDPQEIEQSADQGTPTPQPAQVAVDPRQRVAQAMASPYAPVRQMAVMDFNASQQDKTRADARDARAQELAINRDQRVQDLQLQHQQRMEALRLQNASREDTARAQREHQEAMARLVASLRQPNQPQVVQTATGPMVLGPNGTASPIVGADGKPVQSPRGGNKPMSATAQKELLETEEQIAGANDAINSLRQALSINNKAFEGGTAGARAKALNLVGAGGEGTNATIELNNLVGSQALSSLKAIFGGMPTEGERKILLDISGSADQPATVRKGIFDRAIAAAERRIQMNQSKAKQLRDGTYFTEQGGLPGAAGQPTVVDW